MQHRSFITAGLLSFIVFACISFSNIAQGQDYTLTDLQYLVGDTQVQTSVNDQTNSRICAGGPGFLVVWEDERTNLSGFNGVTTTPLMGNQTDIYAARLDSAGNLLDESPIIITNEGTHQTEPEIAWNGENWLVVYETQRPDWYFFTDIYATRVSPEGVVLDNPPIPIRLENNNPSNDYGQNPSVTSDGTNWVVVWQDQTWQGYTPYPNVVGARIAPDGTIIDDPPVLLYQGTIAATFGPILPQMSYAGDEFLLVWEKSGYHQIFGRRFDLNLYPIDQTEFLIAGSYNEHPRIASDGTDFFVVSRQRYGFRVNHAGQVLDPGGIFLALSGAFNSDIDVTWDGNTWAVAHDGTGTFSSNMYLTRVTTGGTLVPPGPTRIQFTTDDQYYPAVASAGDGSVVVSWDQRDEFLSQGENIRSARVDDSWNVTNEQDVSVGLHRQSAIRFASNNNEHLSVFLSQGGGATRIQAQRLDSDGNVIDPEPITIASTIEGYSGISGVVPDVTFNGNEYLVVWAQNSSVMGMRLSPDGTPIDPTPVTLVTDNVAEAAIGALGNDYYLVYSYIFSGDQIYLKGARVDGTTMSLIDLPVLINPSTTLYALDPLVYGFGDRWLVVWEAQVTHDQLASTIRGLFVDSNGQAGPSFVISQSGFGDDPGVAIAGDRAFVTWYDNYTINSFTIEGRLMESNGSFVAGEFLISAGNNRRISPAAAWDGNQFVAAWTDFRSLTGVVDQLRGDIYTARVDYNGNVLDPDGIQLTAGPLPEDLPAAAGASGKTVIAFSKLNGTASPEVQRIGYRVLENSAGTPVTIAITPINPPIQIPASGGSFDFNAELTNNGTTPANFDVWIMVQLPNSSWYGPVLGPVNLTLAPAITLDRDRVQDVPALAPEGIYLYEGYVGIYPDIVWDSDNFTFEKLSTDDGGSTVAGWACSGEPFADSPTASANIATDHTSLSAYPNPFNPTTTISYTLADAGKVSLSVYDLQGRQVAQLVNGWRDAGFYQIVLDNSNLPAGVYFAHMEVGEARQTQKLLLLK